MTYRCVLLFVPLLALPGCESESLSDPLEARMQEHDQNPHDLPSGNWTRKDGALICRGYLTRQADEDFCAAEVPSDWVPFEFEGKTYYIPPLTGQDL